MELSAKDRAEDVQAGFETLRVLVGCVDSKLRFYTDDNGLFGAYREIIKSIAFEIQTLLCVIDHEIWDMEKQQDQVVHALIAERQGEKSV